MFISINILTTFFVAFLLVQYISNPMYMKASNFSINVMIE